MAIVEVDAAPVNARIDGIDQEQNIEAVSMRIVGKHVQWVDRFGVYHSTTWDPFDEQICINLPKAEE